MIRVRYRGGHSFVHNEHGRLEEGDVVEIGEYTYAQFDQMFVPVDDEADHTVSDSSEADESEADESEADESEADESEADESHESAADDFDAESFVDRTPMADVVGDIESGDYDAHLDAIARAETEGRDRNGVADAIAARR